MIDIVLQQRIEQSEIAMHDRLVCLGDPGQSYAKRKLSLVMFILILIAVPICYLDLRFVSRFNFFYINLVGNQLTDEIKSQLGRVYCTNKFYRIFGKLFILPLRVYSHIVRQEWVISELFSLREIGKKILGWYLGRFIFLMDHRVFFLKEDYHAETSMLASIAAHCDSIKVVSFQHESMSLKRIRCEGIYPGQRASIQIVHDENTKNVFTDICRGKSVILKSFPCYRYKLMSRGYFNIFFLGNGCKIVKNIAFDVLSKFVEHPSIEKCVYIPHRNETDCFSDKFDVCRSVDFRKLIQCNDQKIFLGANPTFLYEAYMAGHKIILIDRKEMMHTDSLRSIGRFSEITAGRNPWDVLDMEISRDDSYVNQEGCLEAADIVEYITRR